MAGLSRYVTHALSWRGPDADGALDELVAIARTHRLFGWVLIAAGDGEMRLLAKHRDEISTVFRSTVPGLDVVRWADDKNLTYQKAQEIGLDTPRRYSPAGIGELREQDFIFPVILKPASHKGVNRFSLAKAWIAQDRAELLARYEDALACVEPSNIIIQEMIPGGGASQFSYAGLWHEGRAVAGLVATRSRQYPIHAGYTSTFVEVVDNQAVEDAAARFLRAIAYSGLVEIEFKHDVRDGRYKILDVNTRLWTWVGLGASAGLDFPLILYRTMFGERVEAPAPQIGRAWMYVSRDSVAAVHEVWAGRLRAVQYARGLWAKAADITPAVFAVDDPLPGIAELPILAYRVLTRRVLRSRRKPDRVTSKAPA